MLHNALDTGPTCAGSASVQLTFSGGDASVTQITSASTVTSRPAAVPTTRPPPCATTGATASAASASATPGRTRMRYPENTWFETGSTFVYFVRWFPVTIVSVTTSHAIGLTASSALDLITETAYVANVSAIRSGTSPVRPRLLPN